MSEKRFICGLGFPINSDDPIRIISDSVEDKDYYKFSDICNVLNEQQATLNKQKEEIINSHIAYVESLNEIKDLKEENEELRRENKKKDIEIQSLNAHITNWLNETKIAKLYENEQYRTETLEKENEQLRQRYYALKKENDRLENNIIHLNEANDFRKKNLKIMELSDTEHNLKMLLTNSDEQTERFIKGLQDENEQLRKQCFELEKDYLIETSDISDKIYLKDEINELKKRYGVKDE